MIRFEIHAKTSDDYLIYLTKNWLNILLLNILSFIYKNL